MSNRKFIVGNWKMNGGAANQSDVADIATVAQAHPGVDVGLCLPATMIAQAADANRQILIGAQDCHAKESGAHTGNLSAEMLSEAGARIVIVGHSERRADHGETNADVKAKAEAALRAGLQAIVCIGETAEERDGGGAVAVVDRQLRGSFPEGATADWLTIAYEPIWAIGTGRTPSPADVEEVHAAVRSALGELVAENSDAVRVLYGGSMNGDNAAELLAVPNVDGGLVGGASLSVAKFGPIIEAAARVPTADA